MVDSEECMNLREVWDRDLEAILSLVGALVWLLLIALY
jgi:hypothetical protein